jgi:hypothetical protein
MNRSEDAADYSANFEEIAKLLPELVRFLPNFLKYLWSMVEKSIET